MENKTFINRVLDYFRSLEGTVEYKTPDYTGFKIYSKAYAEVHISSDHLIFYVNSKFITDNGKNSLKLEAVPDSYRWTLNTKIRVDEENNQEGYFDIIKRCYEGTKEEYEEKLKNTINKAIEESHGLINNYMEMENYAFEKLLNKWKEFITYNISNNSLDELKSDMEALNTFSSGDILNKYKNEEDKYHFLTLLNEVVAYVDKNGYNKNVYNKYEDKRTLALTFVRQNDWVKSLINYKKYNDLS